MRFIALAAIAAALVVPAAQARTERAPLLQAVVGPGFNITLTKAGKKVSTLQPGPYIIKVSDKSSAHNFHLTGPGLNKSTTVGGTGVKTWRVTLQKGTYKYVCDPHATIMKGSFRVK
jgi:plastocyanin